MIERKLYMQAKDKNVSEMLSFCLRHNKVFVYGTGANSCRINQMLKRMGVEIDGFVVSDGHKREESVEGITVLELSSVINGEDVGFILGMAVYYHEEIKVNLINFGVKVSDIYEQHFFDKYLFDRKDANAYSINNGFFSRNKLLDEIGKDYGTDKSSESLNYLNKYEFFFDKWKNDVFRILELGVYRGSSIKMWSTFFPNAEIIGADIDERCKIYEEGNIHIEIGDLADLDFVSKLAQVKPRIVIDDASHIWSHQILALCRIFPFIESGGVYIVEDIVTSFSTWEAKGYDDINVSAYDFLQVLATVVSSGEYLQKKDLKENMGDLIEEIECLGKIIEMISFIQGSCIIIKR